MNDREETIIIVGGFDDGNPKGELGVLAELIAGHSGPRPELGEVLALLRRTRARARLLGVELRHRPLLYDFPCWCQHTLQPFLSHSFP